MATTPTEAASLSEEYQKALNNIKADSQYSATTGAFDESKGVAGRVNQLTSQSNPLFTAAGTRAKQQAASRGLLNSSIATQAGQQAVIETATPIANADASLYQQQQLANQQATNDASARNAAERGQVGMLGFTTNENARQFDASLGMQGRQLDQNQKQFDVTSGQNQQQIENQRTQLQQAQQQIDAQKEQFAQQLGMTVKDLELKRDQLSESQKQFLMSLDQQKAQLAQQQSQFDTAQSNTQANFEADQTQKLVLARMDSELRTKLAEAQAKSQQDIQGSQNISNAWGTMMQSINNVQTNANLDEATKRVLIQNNIDSFQSYTNFWKKVGGGAVDVSDLLNFGTSATPVASGNSQGSPGSPNVYQPDYSSTQWGG